MDKFSYIRGRWRKICTGDEKKRIRDHLKEHLKEKQSNPPAVKLLDKLTFTLGVLNISIIQWFLFVRPSYFWLWYSIVIPLLMLTRFFHFKSLGWHYFMLDFCYFVLMLTLIQLFLLPSSSLLFKVSYIYSLGPLPCAILVWNNSLVFHDYDKMTSVYIHMLPAILNYALKYFERDSLRVGVNYCTSANYNTTLTIVDIVYAAVGYMLWQILYFVKTEIVDKKILDNRPELLTSLRWISMDQKNAMTCLVLSVCKAVKLVKQQEAFNPKTVKTKMIFIASQFIYTIITFTPAYFLYHHRFAHLLYIGLIFTVSIFNGASFYIEVFSQRYQKQLRRQQDLFQVVSRMKSVQQSQTDRTFDANDANDANDDLNLSLD